MNQAKPKLTPLPCPFCGKLPRLFPRDADLEGNAWGQVACVNSGCHAQPDVLDGSMVADDRGSGAYIDLAIKKWNKRSADKRARAQERGE